MESIKRAVDAKVKSFEYMKEIFTREFIYEIANELLEGRYEHRSTTFGTTYKKEWCDYWPPHVSINDKGGDFQLKLPLPDINGHYTRCSLKFDVTCSFSVKAKFVCWIGGVTAEKELEVSREFSKRMSSIAFKWYRKDIERKLKEERIEEGWI